MKKKRGNTFPLYSDNLNIGTSRVAVTLNVLILFLCFLEESTDGNFHGHVIQVLTKSTETIM